MVLIFVLIFILSGCDTVSNIATESDSKYLTIRLNQSNSAGLEEISPGIGRYRYDNNVTTKVIIKAAAGYEFLGWEGRDKDKLAKESSTSFSIYMEDDYEIKAIINYIEFMLLGVDIDDTKNIEAENIEKNNMISHTTNNLFFKLNNFVSPENKLIVSIEDPDNPALFEEFVTDLEAEIDENMIIINLEKWFNEFSRLYYDEVIDYNLDFDKRYILKVESEYANNIFDIKNMELDDEIIELNFKIEIPYPEVPDIESIIFQNEEIIFSWHRAQSLEKFDVNNYVEKYIVQRSKNESSFTNITEFTINSEIYDENNKPYKIIRFVDSQNLDLANNTYYYRVIAVNEFGNQSEVSDIRSTDEI